MGKLGPKRWSDLPKVKHLFVADLGFRTRSLQIWKPSLCSHHSPEKNYEITRGRGRRRMKGKEKKKGRVKRASTQTVNRQAIVPEGLWLSINNFCRIQTILRHGHFLAMEKPFGNNNNPWLSLIIDKPLSLVLIYRIGEKNGQAKNG